MKKVRKGPVKYYQREEYDSSIYDPETNKKIIKTNKQKRRMNIFLRQISIADYESTQLFVAFLKMFVSMWILQVTSVFICA